MSQGWAPSCISSLCQGRVWAVDAGGHIEEGRPIRHLRPFHQKNSVGSAKIPSWGGVRASGVEDVQKVDGLPAILAVVPAPQASKGSAYENDVLAASDTEPQGRAAHNISLPSA